ncbi:low-specificity L-threonine aldolase [Candidatus Bathyarchaeota archaeon]|nr:low-specificity L-threonine aldolase [Candidatus Bathyarchaeota archaeon]NIR15966.1 low-specificity L-threonine aldolase [Desulfobacterales bacterium]NIU81374.1 low-specificity L-threonine aldolase [Candidatus Bathyarchaeota archaeon]NIV67994.1 low-specificity L-threonine aldolase [Candidatus Bathyarchaeota archaeon]NIW34534.1 low-specificity L-threonine aldolase [Candidatus Bathyarchaeota archaeon]
MSSNQEIIDLRSDTVTLPTQEMLEAIRNAELGDDVYGEDPTVNRLEDLAAKTMGKEAALLVTSGTQANLVSLMSHTQPGDSVILEADSHIYWYEVGGLSAIGGLQPLPIPGRRGVLDPEKVRATIRPRDIHFPPTTLVCLEDTHNRAGGTIISPEQIRGLRDVAHAQGLPLYLDGARIFNAAVALDREVQEFTKYVDSLMFCLSKGLSCPVGSIVVGSQEFIDRARKVRKRLGGGMRQAGVIAAPGIIALQKMVPRLQEDHQNAQHLAQGLNRIQGISINPERVQTNILHPDISSLGVTSHQFVLQLKEQGLLALPRGKDQLRLVTHRGITTEHIERAITICGDVAKEMSKGRRA